MKNYKSGGKHGRPCFGTRPVLEHRTNPIQKTRGPTRPPVFLSTARVGVQQLPIEETRGPTRPPVLLRTARVGMRNVNRFVGFKPFQLIPGALLTLYY